MRLLFLFISRVFYYIIVNIGKHTKAGVVVDNNDKNSKQENSKPDYHFGGIKTYSLEEIEKEVLNDNVYLDVFAGSDLRFKENIRPLSNVLKFF